MNLGNAYKQKLEAQFKDKRARLDALKERAKRVAADGRVVGHEELAKAEKRLGEFAEKVKRVAGASAGALTEVRHGLGKALDNLTTSTKKAATHLSKAAAQPAAKTTARSTTPKARRAAAPKMKVPTTRKASVAKQRRAAQPKGRRTAKTSQ
jgi:hypothetical protein